MPKYNNDSEPSPSCVYVSPKINNKNLETILTTVSTQFNMYIVNYGREKENIT